MRWAARGTVRREFLSSVFLTSVIVSWCRVMGGLALWMLLSCTHAPEKATTGSTPKAAASSVPAARPGTSGVTQAPQSSATGFGRESVSPEQLKKYAPRALDAHISQKVESLIELRAPGLGVVSPTGKRLYFTWNVTGTKQVWVVDGPLRFPRQLTGGESATSLERLTPDGRKLILSRDDKGDEQPGLFWQAATGGRLHTIFQRRKVRAYAMHVTANSRSLYFIANDLKPESYAVYRHDFSSGQNHLIFAEPGLWVVQDVDEKRGLLLLNKGTGSESREYFFFDLKSKQLTPLFGQGEESDYTAYLAPRGRELIVKTNAFADYQRLYHWKKGRFKLITPPVKFDIASFQLDRQRRRLVYTVNQRGFLRLHARDARTFKKLRLPRFKGATHVSTGEFSTNGRFLSLGVSPESQPRRNYVYDWKTQRLRQWVLPSMPEVDTTEFVKAELMSIPVRDGTRLPAFVWRPKSAPRGGPVIVNFHGGPAQQSLPGFHALAQLFVQAGYTYVAPNVRGSSGYGRRWQEADNGAKRLNVITDLEDVALYLRKTGRSAQGREPKLGVLGGSYGGYSVLYAMTRFAGRYDAGVSMMGLSDLRSFLRNTAPYRRRLRAAEYGDLEKDREALKELSPTSYVQNFKGPLLLIQGATDPRVPVGEALQFYHRLAWQTDQVELMIFPDEGHGARKRKNRVLLYGHSLRFFDQHLK